MTVATLTEHYRGYLLVEVDGRIKVHPAPGRSPREKARTALFVADSVDEARAWVDAWLDGPEIA